MPERVSSDHDAVETRRVTLASVGRTDRVRVELPEDVGVAPGDLVWVALDGEAGFAQVDETLDGTPVVGRVVANRRQARENEGEDRLASWAENAPVSPGESVHLDVLTEGFAYGVRTPGSRVVYAPPDRPDDSLADIARDVGRD